MYEAFYGLKEKPFSIQPNPAYLYLGERHSLAYSMLEYGVGQGAGFTVITGEVGCGKTTLIRHLLNHLDQHLTVGLISNTQQDADELLRWVLLAFGQPYDAPHKVGLFDQLQRFLIEEYARGHRAVLIVDEAQNLSPAALEELRMLSNINADEDQLLQLVLVGQPQLKALLRQPELLQLAQRVAADFHIPRLDALEASRYILHRLAVAGRQAPLFDAAAVQRICQAASGVPRSINILCDMALVYGYSSQAPRITREIVDEVLADKAKHGVLPLQERTEPPPPDADPAPLKLAPLEPEVARLLFSKSRQESS